MNFGSASVSFPETLLATENGKKADEPKSRIRSILGFLLVLSLGKALFHPDFIIPCQAIK